MSLTVAVLITNFNTWELSRRCIQALNDWSSQYLAKILIIDDASTEEAPSDLTENITVIKNSQNQGYVASVNIGFSSLSEDIILLLDSDAYPKGEIIQSVVQSFTDNSNLGALGFQLLDRNNRPTGSCEDEPTALGLVVGQALDSKMHSWFRLVNDESPCIFSCAIAIRKIAFEDINGFDAGFDFLDADNDFSIRLRRAGWDVRVDRSLTVFHEGGGSEQTTAKRVLRHHKNRWRLLEKHGFVSNSLCLKIGLATRHLLEYGILRIFGQFLIKDSARLEDKLYSRQQLLLQVWSAYGNESR